MALVLKLLRLGQSVLVLNKQVLYPSLPAFCSCISPLPRVNESHMFAVWRADGTAVMTAVVVMCGVVLTAAVVTVGVACVCIRIKRLILIVL